VEFSIRPSGAWLRPFMVSLYSTCSPSFLMLFPLSFLCSLHTLPLAPDSHLPVLPPTWKLSLLSFLYSAYSYCCSHTYLHLPLVTHTPFSHLCTWHKISECTDVLRECTLCIWTLKLSKLFCSCVAVKPRGLSMLVIYRVPKNMHLLEICVYYAILNITGFNSQILLNGHSCHQSSCLQIFLCRHLKPVDYKQRLWNTEALKQLIRM
jgi:hypothetical protein